MEALSYQALYRKYRPRSFAEVVGQPHIITTLKNQMLHQRISHAYLFCGTRGSGKTSVAKIFAKAINCTSPEEGEPCRHCENCQLAAEGRNMNIIEIDAASNNGVDNIREIREEVKYPPTSGKYKVYIIDEVHMLSAGAFNALLKTLEEPPGYVVFILATTEPQKVPITILSRCQRFDFHRISIANIENTLENYLSQEGVAAQTAAVQYVASLADGSLRDALSILDQCISYYVNEELTLDKVLEVCGAVDQSVFFRMVDALGERNARAVLDLVEEISKTGRNWKQFVSGLFQHIRNLLTLKVSKSATFILDMNTDAIAQLEKQTANWSVQSLLTVTQSMVLLLQDIKYTDNERTLIEITLLKLCSSVSSKDISGLLERMDALEKALAAANTVASATPAPVQQKREEPAPTPKPKKKALPEDFPKLSEAWQTIKSNSFSSPSSRSLWETVALRPMDNGICLVFDFGWAKDSVKGQEEDLKQLFEKQTGYTVSLCFMDKKEYDSQFGYQYVQPEELDLKKLKEALPDLQIE